MVKNFTRRSEPRRVLRRTVAQLLRRLRAGRNETPEEVATRFRSELKSGLNDARYAESEIAQLFDTGGIDAVEDIVDGAIAISYDDCVLLSQAYLVHRLLVDPVLSAPADDVCLVERLESFFVVVAEPSAQSYGSAATYRTPDRSLAGASSVSMVHLRLEPEGYSDTHWHPGDELLLVLRGSVDVLLLDCGLRARLNAGDYIHFYAEHEHCQLNAGSDPAEMFIIRFQRSKQRAALIDGLRVRKPKASVVVTARQGFLSAIVPRPSWGPGQSPSDTVVDRSGLGRFLQLLCERGFRDAGRLTLDALAEKGGPLGISRARFDRIHHGLSPVSQEELLTLAKVYEVEPMLLFDFLCPALRSAVVVRSRPDPDVKPVSHGDMRCLPENFLQNQTSVYKIPCRRLADTDVGIASLYLPPGAQSPVNRHPGHEVLLPLKGEIRVRFAGGVDAAVSADRAEFTHFNSTRNHLVENRSTEDAEVFMVRVHE